MRLRLLLSMVAPLLNRHLRCTASMLCWLRRFCKGIPCDVSWVTRDSSLLIRILRFLSGVARSLWRRIPTLVEALPVRRMFISNIFGFPYRRGVKTSLTLMTPHVSWNTTSPRLPGWGQLVFNIGFHLGCTAAPLMSWKPARLRTWFIGRQSCFFSRNAFIICEWDPNPEPYMLCGGVTHVVQSLAIFRLLFDKAPSVHVDGYAWRERIYHSWSLCRERFRVIWKVNRSWGVLFFVL